MARGQKSNPAGTITALIILLLIVVALIIVLRSCTQPEPEAAPTPTIAVTAEPTAEPSPSETPSPSPSQTPAPTPTPTPAPTPEPTEAPVVAGSGSFRSDTGTGLNIVADWTAASAGSGKVDITVTLYAESYSLHCNEIWNGATVVVGDRSTTFSTSAVSYDGTDLGKSPLGSVSVELSLSEGGALQVPISAAWNFGGTYSGTELETIEASDTAVVG